MPPVGLQMAAHGAPLTTTEIRELGKLRPAHIWATLDLTRPAWDVRLDQAFAETGALDALLEIEVLSPSEGDGLDALAETLAMNRARVGAVHVYLARDRVTTSAVLQRARAAFSRAGLDVLLGGGAQTYPDEATFAQLPLADMDFLAYSAVPGGTPHDGITLASTLEAQGAALVTARHVAGTKPVRVGPITFRSYDRPAGAIVATSPAAPPDDDLRQLLLLSAAWTAASVGTLIQAGVSALTYFETTGSRGVMALAGQRASNSAASTATGMRFPIYHVLESACRGYGRGTEVLPVVTDSPGTLGAFAIRHGGDLIRLTLANLLPTAQRVFVSSAGGRLPTPMVSMLDETTYTARAFEPSYRWPRFEHRGDSGRSWELLPYGIAFLEFERD
jgi:hypothetical protein